MNCILNNTLIVQQYTFVLRHFLCNLFSSYLNELYPKQHPDNSAVHFRVATFPLQYCSSYLNELYPKQQPDNSAVHFRVATFPLQYFPLISMNCILNNALIIQQYTFVLRHFLCNLLSSYLNELYPKQHPDNSAVHFRVATFPLQYFSSYLNELYP